MFVQKLNPLTGEADWVLVNDPGLGDEDDASADLVATSSYLDMLTDSRRNAAYAAALRRVIPAVAKANAAKAAKSGIVTAAATAETAAKAGDDATSTAAGTASTAVAAGPGSVRVLDIGTGTGLLAMMAARALQQLQPVAGGSNSAAAAAGAAATAAGAAPSAGAESGGGKGGKEEAGEQVPPDAPPSAPVAACEVFPPMQNLSRKVIAANGLSQLIRVVNKRSDEMVVRPPPAAATGATAGGGGGGTGATTVTPHQQRLAAARAKAAAAAAGGAPGSDPDPVDMHERVDVVVTEIFDSELLGEGMIPTMRHAVQHLIKEGGCVIPAHSRLYGQLVECPTMSHMAGLRRGSSGGAAASRGADAATAAAGRVLDVLGQLDARARAALHESGDDEMYEVREMHVDLLHEYDVRRGAVAAAAGAAAFGSSSGSSSSAAGSPEETVQQPQQLSIRPLSEPFLVFDFDWMRPPPPSGRKTRVQVPATAPGSAHAVLLWWQLGMTPGDSPEALDAATAAAKAVAPASGEVAAAAPQPPPLLLSTAPCWLIDRVCAGGDGGPSAECGLRQGWRDHWKQCWVQLAAEAPALAAGQVLILAFEHDDVSLRGKMVGGGGGGSGSSGAAAAAPGGSTAATAQAAPAGVAAAIKDAAASDAGSGSSSSAKEVLAALRAEAVERQQLIPLMGCLGPQALWQLGDEARLATFSRALQRALEQAGAVAPAGHMQQQEGGSGSSSGSDAGGAEVVVVDGSLALGLLAAAHPAVSSVTLLQESSMAVNEWITAAAARLLGAAAAASKIRAVRSEAYFKRLAAGVKASGSGAPASSPAASEGPLVLLAEPYYSEFEQLVPWAHLRFWRDYDVIRGSAAAGAAGGAGGKGGAGAKGGRRRQVVCLPARARLVAVAASLPELYRTRTALGTIEGLDLSPANNVLGVVGGGSGSGGGGGSDAAAPGGAGTSGRGGKAKRGEEDDDADVWGDEDEDSDEEAGSAAGAGRQPLPILPYAMWQAGGGYRELSARTPLLQLDCTGHLGDMEGDAVLELLQPPNAAATADSVGNGTGKGDGTEGSQEGVEVHAVVLWLEYDLLGSGEGEEEQEGGKEGGNGSSGCRGGSHGAGSRGPVVSTGPCPLGGPGPAVQGVYLLPRPLRVGTGGGGPTCSRLHVAAEFDGLDADMNITVTPLP